MKTRQIIMTFQFAKVKICSKQHSQSHSLKFNASIRQNVTPSKMTSCTTNFYMWRLGLPLKLLAPTTWRQVAHPNP